MPGKYHQNLKNLVIVGIGTTAKQVYELICYHKLFNVLGFAVNKNYLTNNTFQGMPVFELEHLSDCISIPFSVFVAIQWNRLNADRKKVFDFCCSKGYDFSNIISPTAVVRSEIKGKNCLVDDYCVIMDHVSVADNVYMKPHSVVADHVTIGPHTFIGIHAVVGGACTIGDQTFIGMNAVIFDQVKVGRKCIVGAGTALKRNLPDFCRFTTKNDFTIKQYREEDIENKLLFSKNIR